MLSYANLVVALALVSVCHSSTLLTAISETPDLSTFSNLITKSGGPVPNPALEERFNSAQDTRKYTAFIPTNAAMAALPSGFLDQLATPDAYALLIGLIRAHISQADITPDQLKKAGDLPVSVEGLPLKTTASGAGTMLNGQAGIDYSSIAASNGRIYKIDRLLSPYSGIFGPSTSTAAVSTTAATSTNSTLADLIATKPNMATVYSALQVVTPDFLASLALEKFSGKQVTYVVPSGAALDALTIGGIKMLEAPSNHDFSDYLLQFGLLQSDSPSQQLLSSTTGNTTLKSSQGFDLTITKNANGAVMVNNAAVTELACAQNGCLWITDTILDPMYSQTKALMASPGVAMSTAGGVGVGGRLNLDTPQTLILAVLAVLALVFNT